MAGFVKKGYIVLAAVLILLMFYYLAAYRNKVEFSQDIGSYEILKPVEVAESKRASKDAGPRQTIRLKLEHVEGDYCTLMFYTLHQNVVIYSGSEVIYNLKASTNNSFTKTPGCVWNSKALDSTMNGKEIRIELTSVYPGISYDIPEIYLGEKGAIVKNIIGTQIFPLVTSIALIVIGLSFCGYVLYNFKNSEVDKNFGMLGLFAALTGIWKLCDLSITKFLFRGFPVVSLLPFIALMMGVIPCVCFLMEMHSTKDQKIWMVPCWVSLAVIYISLILQFFNLMDLRQLLPLIWVAIIVGVGVTSYMVTVEFKKVGWNKKLRSNLAGFAIIFLGVFMDMGGYLLSGGRNASFFAILGFLLYMVILGYHIIQESGALMIAGEGAQRMEDMAYHDKMTGCYNRSAFIVDTDPYAVVPDDYVVAVLDLNNLKKCNDVLGHEKGDLYIRDSAKIILETFGKLGNCYRMGGDEFYCLIPKGGLSACREQKASMDKLVEEYNAKGGDIRMGIACGYARYDRRLDYDLKATARRADGLMYKNKEMMKKNQL